MTFQLDSGDYGNLYIHVPTAGDHYSPATGSATMAVIYELSRQHERVGGQTQVIVGSGTRHDYPVGQQVEVMFAKSPTKRQKILDAGFARLGLPRKLEAGIYSPASAVIDPKFDGPVFLHNSPGAVPLFKKEHKNSQVCLYAVNALFRTYNNREVRRTVDIADHVICCSEFIANDLLSRLCHTSDKVKVVENGVDVERFCANPRPLDAEIPTVLFVGRAVPDKGPDLLIQAARKIFGSRRRFKIRIVGSHGYAPSAQLTSYERQLRQLAAPLGDAVEFQASVDRERLLREYQSASVFCVPSNWDDPFPLTVLEAMSCGLPVIASRRGGIPEEGGDAILYFQPPKIDELAEHLAYLIDDPHARKEWGDRARARVERFRWENQYEKLRRVLRAT